MIEEGIPHGRSTLAEQIQALGFEPDQLTLEEQAYLLEIQMLLSEESVLS